MKKSNKSPQREPESKEERLKKVHEIFSEVQLLRTGESRTDRDSLTFLSNNWKHIDIPLLQRRVVDQQILSLKEGIIDPVFIPLIDALNSIHLQRFSLLDAACASGYYSEVILLQTSKDIQYRGSDYSEAMIEEARKYYPNLPFDVQDLTKLTYPDDSYDVVLLSGVLEHVPRFEDAISEACRVSSAYVIVHRCQLTSGKDNEYTKGSQYNIETPRIYFAQNLLIDQFKRHGFLLSRKFKIYKQSKPFFSKVIANLRKMINQIQSREPHRFAVTLLFRRK